MINESAANVSKFIEDNGYYAAFTVGVSMRPLFRERKDTVVIRKNEGRLSKYDVALYSRGDDLVLHRVIKVLPDSYIILGDNCIGKEHVCDNQVIGVLTEFYRGDKHRYVTDFSYRLYSRVWVFWHPIRNSFVRIWNFGLRIASKIYHLFKK